MRTLLIMLLAAAVITAVAGCGEKEPEQTSAIQVENPPQRPAPEPPPAPPMSMPPPGAQAPPEKKTVTRDGWTVYESGLKYKDTKTGDGMEAKLGDLVTVHYKGQLDNGKVFDSSKRRGPGHPRLGRGNPGDEGRWQARTHRSAGTGIRRCGQRHHPAQFHAALRGRDAGSEAVGRIGRPPLKTRFGER